MLVSSHYKVYEIAERVGYTDKKHFSKLFTTYQKFNPREYRRKHQVELRK
ncbi:hypothetical protein ACH6EH_11335 [Paenibacillus sp. JSM ZJ436]|uniref:HTH araC/xylS-type domain-containing protein n=1 Tax=Paenibacillus algicola TaxID=2565926 RepID=A0A4P8XJG4_9BACL|nr:hypothetical protein E6C60_0780 [Paenibacillus algicola]